MVQWFDEIGEEHADWIKKQKIFFVATAPLDGQGCVNTSPKGYDCFRSGIETQSHLEENGRITIMLAAFEGGPRVMRLIGTGRVVRVGSPEFSKIMDDHYQGTELYRASGKRSIILADIRKVGTSCGYAVPFFDYRGPRPTLINHWAKKGEEDVKKYWLTKNMFSVDGLPGMRHEWLGPEWIGKNRVHGPVELPDWATIGSKSSTKGGFSTWLKPGTGLANATILSVGIAIGAGVATIVSKRR
ncbi:hypothetical protein BGX21_000817 [Mortierella sp. AD011]|nr:hypothetical protein BGX20_003613 [Mortierella sp. AD010]KAF9386392.1 hypothetical protein BGX21_000817 [Mortierella sp. AD011]